MTKGNLYDDVFVKALSTLNIIAITFSDNAELQQIVSTQTEKNLNCQLWFFSQKVGKSLKSKKF